MANNALLQRIAAGAQPRMADAMFRGARQGNALMEFQREEQKQNALAEIAQTYATGGPQAASQAAGRLGQLPQTVALGQQGYERQRNVGIDRRAEQKLNLPRSAIGKLWNEERRGLVPAGTTQKKINAIGKSGTNIDINTGDTSNIEGELIKNLGKKMGVSWSAMADQGRKAAGMAREMEMLDELIQYAPQGPLTGRLAQAFPGVSNAGAAFESIVKRLAPQQRAEGSGSTSDIEFAGMLASMPALRNNPEANMLISGAVKRKSQIDMQMANVIEDYTTRKISFKDAQDALRELNNTSMMTPELHALVQGAVITKDQSGETADPIFEKYQVR